MEIMVEIDMHVKRLVCELGVENERPKRCMYSNDEEGHRELLEAISEMQIKCGADSALVAYEASGLGYALHDRVVETGYRCAVLAPSEMLRSATGYKKKTDKKDCTYIYETMRAHVLAGNRLPAVWVPNKQLREDREIVRARFDVGQKLARVKVQIHTLLKKQGIRKPEELNNWTKKFRAWLKLMYEHMGNGFRISLDSLLRQLEFLEQEHQRLRLDMLSLSREDRYRDQCVELLKIAGVGLVTAMTFLTEIGDVKRFDNRRQVGAFAGLVPSSFESGERSDRKGRITRDGPYRLRSVLNQALWMHLKYNGEEREVYDRIAEKNPKRKKKAVVAGMRRLVIRMWHVARDVEDSKHLRRVAA